MYLKSIGVLYMFLVLFICSNIVSSQTEQDRTKLGFSFGKGFHNKFPFNSEDYSHEVEFYKVIFNYRFKESKNWAFEFVAEPSYNRVEHQLLNKWFIQPSDGQNYLELREIFTKKRMFNEYVLNLGLIARYKLFRKLSVYAVGSVGPMVADKGTERLASGFAFSDVFGLGLSYDSGKVRLCFRYSVRHTSNLEMKQPNNGHNTTNAECSVLFNL
ncbi:hypothetical protein EYD45_10695 [Hyunsoonleella flava]|uniref:Acyloxyacyl hydrolase n=1 Tax=Hyunsoonleella flava TaxID=2527939 RepID=A0A4Q9FD57_9FLAO|nr:acyloxyacyl hydrolase [Hyunsoonleella flava]TBN03013.1 hypothetical protein EYD45_10695 [Hyunsoonleella flava]